MGHSNRFLTVISILSLAGLLAACGTSAAGHRGGVSNKVAAAHIHASSGGNLVIGTTEEPDTLNPQITQLVTSANMISGMMEGMIDHDQHQHVVYKLATSYKVAKDGKTYTWFLRKGVKFQNGAPFSAKDVIAMYHMIMNPKFGAFSQDGWNKISSISDPNPYTVVMHTKQVFAPFAVDVGGTAIAPYGELAKGPTYYKQKFGRHPIGTGPFTFVKWVSGDRIVMKRNPNYWGHKASINTITFKIVPNDNTEMVQLKTGELQATDTLAPDKVKIIKQMSNERLLVQPSLSWYHLDIKNIGFLEDTRVRQALAYATPIQEIISRLMYGYALPDPTDQTPGTWAFDPNVKPYAYDPNKAASLLAAAGFKKNSSGTLAKGGKTLSIEYWIPSGESLSLQVMQVVAQSWRKLGIDVSTHTQSTNTIWGPTGYQFNKKMTVGGYSWFNGDDPDDRFYFNSADIPKSPTGTGGDAPEYFAKYPWQSQIDKLTNEGVANVDQTKRKQIYWQEQELLHQQEPLLFMYSVKEIYAYPKNLSGFDANAYSYGMLSNAQNWTIS